MGSIQIVVSVVAWYLLLCATCCYAEDPYRTDVVAESLSLVSCEHAREECLRSLVSEHAGVSEFIFYCQSRNLAGSMGRARFFPIFGAPGASISPHGCSVSKNQTGPELSFSVSCRARLACL